MLYDDQYFQLGTILLSDATKKTIKDILDQDSSSVLPFVSLTGDYEHVGDSKFKHDFLKNIRGSIIDKMQYSSSKLQANPTLDEKFFEEFQEKTASYKYKGMLAKRVRLPAFKMNEEIINLIENNQVCVISGDTGE